MEGAMRQLGIVLALLMAACGERVSVATYLTETFSAGAPLHAEATTPGWGEYDNPPNWSTTYPVSLAYYADVVGGKLGTSSTYSDEWWVIFQHTPFSAGGPGQLSPAGDAGKGRIQFDVTFASELWGQMGGYGLPLWDVSGGYFDATYDLALALDNGHYGTQYNPFRFKLYGSLASASAQGPIASSSPMGTPLFQSDEIPYATLLDGEQHTIEVTWQCGTLSWWDYPHDASPPDNVYRATVAADGWITVKLDGVPVIHHTGIRLIVNHEGTCNNASGTYYSRSSAEAAAAVNRFTAVSFGDDDAFYGELDNIIIGTPITDTWVDVPNFKREWLDASQYPGGAARCLCMLWATAAGVNVQARLVSLLADDTIDAVVGTSADVTATDPTDATFAVALTGNKRHKLQLTSSTPLTDLWCAPGAKVAP
jgi:hypothetical protein